jgi:excisionase family DNA binding protein
MNDPILLGVEPAAAALGICRSQLYELIGDGSIRSVKIGKRRLIERAELDRFVAKLPVG